MHTLLSFNQEQVEDMCRLTDRLYGWLKAVLHYMWAATTGPDNPELPRLLENAGRAQKQLLILIDKDAISHLAQVLEIVRDKKVTGFRVTWEARDATDLLNC